MNDSDLLVRFLKWLYLSDRELYNIWKYKIDEFLLFCVTEDMKEVNKK